MASEAKKRVQARARVQVTIEIDVPDRWGAECSVEQVQRQAAESALAEIRRAFRPCEDHGGVRFTPMKTRLIDEPRVVTVLAEEER
jgi:hypothetical protein